MFLANEFAFCQAPVQTTVLQLLTNQEQMNTGFATTAKCCGKPKVTIAGLYAMCVANNIIFSAQELSTKPKTITHLTLRDTFLSVTIVKTGFEY